MKMPLAYYGDAVLRRKATPVKEITEEIIQLINDMVDTMVAYNGMGLAAPQVHKSICLFITAVPIEDEEGKLRSGKVKVYINPKLSEPSHQTWNMEEGCLSIPKLYAEVARPVNITVEATDLEGHSFVEHLSGLDARVVMHENDHINGVLFIDRLAPGEKKRIDGVLQKIKKHYKGLKR